MTPNIIASSEIEDCNKIEHLINLKKNLEKSTSEYFITIIDHNTGSIKNLGENLPRIDDINR